MDASRSSASSRQLGWPREARVSECDPDRVAVLLGTGVGGLTTLQEQCTSFIERGERGVSPNFVPMMMPNAAAGQVAIHLGLHGRASRSPPPAQPGRTRSARGCG